MKVVDLVPDVDDAAVAAAAVAGGAGLEELGEHLSAAWAAAYRSQIPQSALLEFESDGARFLFDLASGKGPHRRTGQWPPGTFPTRTPAHETSPTSGATRHRKAAQPGHWTRGHMVPHAAGGTFGPNIFPQDRDLNRGWSMEGRRYRALEREIATTPGTFFFCCLLYADHTDFPTAVKLGALRPNGLHAEQFWNRFDL